jgi:hypothetical protein
VSCVLLPSFLSSRLNNLASNFSEHPKLVVRQFLSAILPDSQPNTLLPLLNASPRTSTTSPIQAPSRFFTCTTEHAERWPILDNEHIYPEEIQDNLYWWKDVTFFD